MVAELQKKMNDFECMSLQKYCPGDLCKYLIMAVTEIIKSRLMCVRCYLSSSSSSSRGKRARTRVSGQHNERYMACQLGQLLLLWG